MLLMEVNGNSLLRASAGPPLSAFGGAQEFLAVLQAQAAAPEARLEERLHPLRAVHEGVDFFELPRGEGAPAGRGRRLLREARQEHPGLADGESRLEREPDEVDPAEHGLAVAALPGSARRRRQKARLLVVRSEERRVGKECTTRRAREYEKTDKKERTHA